MRQDSLCGDTLLRNADASKNLPVSQYGRISSVSSPMSFWPDSQKDYDEWRFSSLQSD